jgi:hypothetical protein
VYRFRCASEHDLNSVFKHDLNSVFKHDLNSVFEDNLNSVFVQPELCWSAWVDIYLPVKLFTGINILKYLI